MVINYKLLTDELYRPERTIMKKIIIAGAGYSGQKLCRYILDNMEDSVVAIFDNNSDLYTSNIYGIPVIPASEISEYSFDEILISQINEEDYTSVYRQLSEYVDEKKLIVVINTPDYIEAYSDQRSNFIKDFAKYCEEEGIKGDVAECGVFRGECARFINRYFPDRRLYLFDTFQGFDKQDIEYEKGVRDFRFDKDYIENRLFKNTAIDQVMKKMKYPDNVVIKQGYFPESSKGTEDCLFCFVNLDMDLYKPMYAGLEFFLDRMVPKGCILLHDYYHENWGGVKEAVRDYEAAHNLELIKLPIGDGCSIAVIKC